MVPKPANSGEAKRRREMSNLSKTAAIKKARSEVSMNGFSGNWEVLSYEPDMQAWMTSQHYYYTSARAAYANEIIARALSYMTGIDYADAHSLVFHEYPGGTIRERLDVLLAK